MPKINNIGESTPTLVAHPTREALAADAVGRIFDILEHVLTERTVAHVSLTGGTMGIATLRAWAASARVKDIDWSRVHFWFSDERFVPERDAERNDGQAIEALLADLTDYGFPVENAHRIGPSDVMIDVEAAAEHYAYEMRKFAGSADPVRIEMPEGASELPLVGGHGGAAESEPSGGGCGCGGCGCGGGSGSDSWPVPMFDVTLLGMGPDGHIASLFPGRQQVLLGTGLPEDPVDGAKAVTVMVKDSPKPPSERVSVTLPVINSSRHIFFLITGGDKQEATTRLLQGAQIPAEQLTADLLLATPAVGARGQKQTLIFATEESLA